MENDLTREKYLEDKRMKHMSKQQYKIEAKREYSVSRVKKNLSKKLSSSSKVGVAPDQSPASESGDHIQDSRLASGRYSEDNS
mmetsp:Transcript_21462/g.19037  ORF Transcript_21462/g.19037 Transcript_21462/m.19037 type:complete len:83 (-) Transcript_21462:14-262(-)